jgi:hypothetical protein
MANRDKGEVGITIGGQPYTLVLDIDAMIAVEERLSTPDREVTFQDVMLKADRGSVTYTRLFFWALVQRHHPTVTLEAAGHLLMEAGGMQAVLKVLAPAVVAASPDPRDLKALGIKLPKKGANPRKAQDGDGTGAISTASPVASA